MFKRVLLVLLLSGASCTWAQGTAAIQGFCDLGGSQAKTSGLNSTNYQQGIIPSCTVTVYLTGTTTKATIYADGSNTPLSNPFTAAATGSSAPGQWIFWAAINQGYDVVMSGGIAPNTYPQPVTLTDVYPGFSFTGSGISLQTNGTDNASQTILNHVNSTDCTWTNPSGGEEQVSCDFNGALQMFVPDPLGTQSVVVPFTVATNFQNGSGFGPVCTPVSTPTSGQILMTGGGSNLGCSAPPGPNVTWSSAVLPAYITPANVTAIYAVGTVGYTGTSQALRVVCEDTSSHTTTLMDGSSIGGSSPPVMAPYNAHLTWATGTGIGNISCVANIAANSEGASQTVILNVPQIALRVYYTGTAPPVNDALNLTSPLYYNPALNSMGVSQINLAANGDGGVVGLLPNANLANPSMTINGTTCTLGSSCTPSGGGGTTTNALTAAATGGAAPGTTFNGSAAVTFDFHSFGAAPTGSPTFTGTVTLPITGSTQCLHVNSAGAVSGTGSECGSGSAGVASLNALTGALSITGDSTITVTPSGSSIALHATGGASLASQNPVSASFYGDSITTCGSLTFVDVQADCWINRVANNLNIFSPTDYAVSGSQAADVDASQVFANTAPSLAAQQPWQEVMVGTNDVFYKGSGAYETTFNNVFTSLVAWLTTPSTSKVAASTGTMSGTCANDTTYSVITGENCTSASATISIPITTTGGPIYIWYRSIDADSGAWTYKVDSGTAFGESTAQTTAISTNNGLTQAPVLIRITGISAGSHTVLFTKTSSTGNMPILAVGTPSNVATENLPYLIVNDIPNQKDGASQAAVTAYRNDILADVNTLKADGLQIYYAPVGSYVAASTAAGDMADTVHPNEQGQGEIATAVLSSVNLKPGRGPVGITQPTVSSADGSVASYIQNVNTAPTVNAINPGVNIFKGLNAGFSAGQMMGEPSSNNFEYVLYEPNSWLGFDICTYPNGTALSSLTQLSCTQLFRANSGSGADANAAARRTATPSTGVIDSNGFNIYSGTTGFAAGETLTVPSASVFDWTHFIPSNFAAYQWCNYSGGTALTTTSQLTNCMSYTPGTGTLAVAVSEPNYVLPNTIYSASGTALPTCGASLKGAKAVVSDATSPSYMGTYTSGGGITAAVICSFDGTTYTWKTH